LVTGKGFLLKESIGISKDLLETASSRVLEEGSFAAAWGAYLMTRPTFTIGTSLAKPTISLEAEPGPLITDRPTTITSERDCLLWASSGKLTAERPFSFPPPPLIVPIQHGTATGTFDVGAIVTRRLEDTNDSSVIWGTLTSVEPDEYVEIPDAAGMRHEPVIRGKGVPVWSIVAYVKRRGLSAEQVSREWAGYITPAEVRAAVLYEEKFPDRVADPFSDRPEDAEW
jgi:uncharacterized protein (DUF433 family)